MAFPAGQDLRVAIQQDSSLSAYFGARNYAGSFPNSVHMNDLWGALRFVRYRNTAATSAFVGSSDDVQLSSFQYIALQAHYLLLLVIMVPSVAVNGLVFVLPYQRVSVRMTSNKFVLNMAVVHLLQTFLVLPFVFVSAMLRRWIFGDMCCKIHGSLTIFLAVANVFSILLIAIDRNCAVNSPLRYAMTIKKRRYSGLIASTWVVALLLSLPPLLDLCDVRYQDSWVTCTVTWYDSSLFTVAYSSVLCVIGFLVPFIWVAWIYASLYRAARRNSARARLNSVNATSSAEISSPSSTGYQGGGHPAFHFPRRMTWSRRSPSLVQASALFGDEWKAVRTSVLVVVSFTACFFPFFFMTLLELHARISNTAFRMLPAIANATSLLFHANQPVPVRTKEQGYAQARSQDVLY
ncbi:hypothetical protein HPB48_000587 [Haemaphysalis longicornis]|uniref:G-protein coupled receptors family 1 profile domain-containing protein n=1 Tax=Haemaphysalis longicornis TaxID=44386 RepID=A0A9J6GNP5_HAELO|nr:hypothetical protein HPB48_000587 [Haemaphysalis longicornis]